MSYDLSLVGLNAVLSNSGARDKLGKLVHYSARGLAGLASEFIARSAKGSPTQILAQDAHRYLRALFVRIMDSRRTVRWLSSTSIVLNLMKPKCPWGEENRFAFTVSQSALVGWHLIDHLRWLQQIGWVRGDQARSKRISFASFVLSASVSLGHWLRQLARAPLADAEAETKRMTTVWKNIVKAGLTLVACLHISELFKSHEVICGACGAVAAGIDLSNAWPKITK